MAAESRQKNRRSLSLFSFEHLRSLSRSGNRPEQDQANDQLCGPSGLSCDPQNQDTTGPKPTAGISGTAVDGLVESPTARPSTRTTFLRAQGRTANDDGQIKPRPRSWFSLSRVSLRNRPKRSLSVQIPKERSSSGVPKNAISAPVLTGTTNMEVAEAEGVCCRDVVDAGLRTRTQEAKPHIEEMTTPNSGFENSESAKPRLFRSTTIRRMQENKRGMPHVVPPFVSEHHSEDTWRFSAIERGVARRHAETVNLCRQKINKITGNGHIRRKSVHMNNGNTPSANRKTGNDDIIRGPLRSDANRKRGEYLTLPNSSSDLAFGSLTRSFASAIDKLDFHSSSIASNMPLMKSKSSIFNIRKRGKKAAEAGSVDLPKTFDGTQHSPADQTRQDDGGAAKLLEDMRQAQAAVQAAARAGKSKLVGAPPEPMQFSEATNTYVPAEPDTAYPGGIKALGMHSNVMEFATAPAWVTDLPKPPHHTPTLEEVTPLPEDDDDDVYKEREENEEDEQDDDDHAIEDAPIYSPSLGDLSQYARPSPPPAQPVIEKEQQSEPETPTRAPAKGHYRRHLGLRKSRSGMALLNLFNKGLKEPKEPKEEGVLQEREENRKETGHRQLKKSRSMNLAALLRKGESTAKKEPLLRENSDLPTRPTKPSPLRYEALMEEEDEKVDEAATPQAGHKRTLPRRQLTPADRAKRMGIVGMPEEYETS